MQPVLKALLITAVLTASTSCNVLLRAASYITEEDYISGKDVLLRLQTAAFLGYALYDTQNPGSQNLLAPMVPTYVTRVKSDRLYLETQVSSCEEIVFTVNALGMSLQEQVMAGLFCNLGPGKQDNPLE